MRIIYFLVMMMTLRNEIGDAAQAKAIREVRTYMSYTWPIDPAKIITMPDMDLSYALVSTLVEWDSAKQFESALASEWHIVGDNEFRFTLKPNLKWSDGTIVTANDVASSFTRGMTRHPQDWRSLINIIESISCPTSGVVAFHLKVKAVDSNLLGKLTESNYGILKTDESGTANASVTTGPFFVAHGTSEELELHRNSNYFKPNPGSAEVIFIKRMPKGTDPQQVLLKDKWPNLTQVPSLVPSDILKQYVNNSYELWLRPTDRVFIFQMSPRYFNENGKKLFRFLSTHISRSKVVAGLDGYQLTTELFPKGYKLHDSDSTKYKVLEEELPEAFKSKPLEILISPERVNPLLEQNIGYEIKRLTGHAPKFIKIPMSEQTKRYKSADYDFYAGTVGLADPDPEGAMSFYLENDFKIIPEVGEHFITRLDDARKIKEDETRFAAMRSILSDATRKGHIVPLFHLSTMGIARHEIDLSEVPATDESVTLSKIRFRE